MTRITGAFIDARRRIIGFMKENPYSTQREIAAGSGASPATVKKHLSAMVEGRLVSHTQKEVAPGRLALAYVFNGIGAKGEGQERVAEIAEEIASVPSMYKWSILIDSEEYRVQDIRPYFVLDGTGTGLKSGKLDDYGVAYKDLPVLDWHVSIYHTGPIDVLMDGDQHNLCYFDQRYKVWIKGSIILIDKAIQKARLTPDGAKVLYEYHVNGVRAAPDEMDWQLEYHWVTPAEKLDGEIRFAAD